jgi:hypothetical protein
MGEIARKEKMGKTGLRSQKTESRKLIGNRLAGRESSAGPKLIVPTTDHGQLAKIKPS